MAIRHFPIFTCCLLVAMIGLYFLVPDQPRLYFNAGDIARGETWRILTGHFTHSDLEHLFWNGLGLAVLGTLIEKRSRSLFLVASVAGISSVSILLMSPFAQLENYCGLSGVLNSLLVVAIWLEWRDSRSGLVIAIGCVSVAKVVIELLLDASLLTHISWPPYAWSHAAGLAGGLMVAWWDRIKTSRTGFRFAMGTLIDKQMGVNQYSSLRCKRNKGLPRLS